MSSGQGTRGKILDAAWRLLESAGANVGLEQVAGAAGVSRQAVYLHFKSRTALLVELVGYIDDRLGLADRARPIREAPDAVAALGALVDLTASYTGKILAVATALDTVRRSDPAAAAAWDDRMESRRRNFRKVIERLEAEHRLSRSLSVDDATDLLWMLLSIRNWEDLVRTRGWTQKRYARHIKRLIRRALVAPRLA